MWNSISYNVKISFFIFVVLAFLGFFSLGALGLGLYYLIFPVAGFLFPHPDSLLGDWVWPSTIGVGILWPLGFIFASILFNFLKKRNWPKVILYFCIFLFYGFGQLFFGFILSIIKCNQRQKYRKVCYI